MYIPFENLPEESKIWIYQSNRKFTDEEFAEIEVVLKDFVENWAAHGKGLEASYQMKYNRFIILAVNQDIQVATGCSIDSSVRFIQDLEQKYNVDLLDKMNVAFKQGEFITYKTLLEFKKLAKENNLMAFSHKGFWQPMDTFREYQMLNEMWDSIKAPWKKWQ